MDSPFPGDTPSDVSKHSQHSMTCSPSIVEPTEHGLPQLDLLLHYWIANLAWIDKHIQIPYFIFMEMTASSADKSLS